ncbi:MAG: corrinoid protein [Bacteroidales bacterium]|jgi:corrinoid protein of di/trimethylamine methyltransferase|nr:corrinoid protein [Bacteroidales bacterium]
MSELKEAIYKGNMIKAKAEVQAALDGGADPQQIIDESMIPAMEAIGKDFAEGRAFVPNLLLSARAMKACLEILKPLMMAENSTILGTVVIGTVKGDLHDIGKNLVAAMLEGRGFKVVNLGADVSKERFIEAARENNADIICLSALLTTTMGYMKEIVDAVREAGLSVKIMVGGAPLNAEYAASIGADGYSSNANEAVALAKSLMGA